MRLNKQIVDKQTIVERSQKYGNNFPFLVKIWTNFLKQRYDIDVPLTPADVAFMFSLHKISRLANSPDDPDTLKDMINYAWLGLDYDQYVEMLADVQSAQNIADDVDAQILHDLLEGKSDSPELQTIIDNYLQRDYEFHCFRSNKPCVFQDKNYHAIKCQYGYNEVKTCDWIQPIIMQ